LIVHANARCEQLLGYDDGELVGHAVEELIPHAMRRGPESHRDGHAAQSTASQAGPGLDLLALRSDGSKLPVEISLAPLETAGGSLVLATLRDVSRSRRDELLFRRFLEAAPDAVVVVDEGGRIMVLNEQVEELFGYDRSELLGESVERLVPEGFNGMHADFRATYAENGLCTLTRCTSIAELFMNRWMTCWMAKLSLRNGSCLHQGVRNQRAVRPDSNSSSMRPV